MQGKFCSDDFSVVRTVPSGCWSYEISCRMRRYSWRLQPPFVLCHVWRRMTGTPLSPFWFLSLNFALAASLYTMSLIACFFTRHEIPSWRYVAHLPSNRYISPCTAAGSLAGDAGTVLTIPSVTFLRMKLRRG